MKYPNESLEKRFKRFKTKYIALQDSLDYLSKQYSKGENLPSEPELADLTNYSVKTIREILVILECFGYVEINHGKPTLIINSFDIPPSEENQSNDMIRKIVSDPKISENFITIGNNFNVGDKLPGERSIKKLLKCGREKSRELLLKLECFGMIYREPGKYSLVVKPISAS